MPSSSDDVYTLAYRTGSDWKLSKTFFETFGEAFDVWASMKVEEFLGEMLDTYFDGVPPDDVLIVSMTRGASLIVMGRA